MSYTGRLDPANKLLESIFSKIDDIMKKINKEFSNLSKDQQELFEDIDKALDVVKEEMAEVGVNVLLKNDEFIDTINGIINSINGLAKEVGNIIGKDLGEISEIDRERLNNKSLKATERLLGNKGDESMYRL